MKPIGVDEFFNRRVIISGQEAHLNDDNTIDSSGITDGQAETVVVADFLQKEDILMGGGGEEFEVTVVTKK